MLCRGDEYMEKLEYFIRSRTDGVLGLNNQYAMRPLFDEAAKYYQKSGGKHGNVQNRKSV